MKFYTLGPDDKFGYPQIDGFGGTVDLRKNQPDNYYNWSDHVNSNTFEDSYPPFAPNLNFLKLSKRAYRSRPTDLLSGHISFSRGMIISERFRNLLQNFKLPEHIYYDVFVEHSSGILPYYYLYFPSTLFKEDLIDFKKSSFYFYNPKSERISHENQFFSNSEEFIKMFNKFGFDPIQRKFLIYNLHLKTELDFFPLIPINYYFYVCLPLIKAIEKSKLLNIRTRSIRYKGEIFMPL